MPSDEIGVKRTKYAIFHQRRGRGTRRWEIGRQLKRGGGTDKSFGDGMTKLEAKTRAAEVNKILSIFHEQQSLAAAYDDLKHWLSKWSELASTGESREIEEFKRIRQLLLKYLQEA